MSSLIDQRHVERGHQARWPIHVISRRDIDDAFAVVSLGEPGPDGRREVAAVHPRASAAAPGLAPGISVRFGLLLPGATTIARRRNATEFTMVLDGSCTVDIDGTRRDATRFDSWNVPSMARVVLANTSNAPTRYVTYSNEAMLRLLEVFHEEIDPPTVDDERDGLAEAREVSEMFARAKELAPPIPLGPDGSALLPYEHLIDPDPVHVAPLMWRWDDIAPHFGILRGLERGYNGRPLFCLYHPATGTKNGTTSSFFATIAVIPTNVVGPVHRHASAAINYIMDGSGWSIVDGVRVEWEAGDIMLSAPGMAPHGHATGDDGAIILTVQDHPLHIATESLIWQENLADGPILSLGTQPGFQTNLADVR